MSAQSFRSALRDETRESHAVVDHAFGRFDLTKRGDYRIFLQAHARVLPAIELALEAAGIESLLPDWPERRRRHLLARDLADLGVDPLPALNDALAIDGEAEIWGMVYVIEGSKLGGAMLARQVPADLPSRYLAAQGPKGSMKLFMDRLDALDPDWLPGAASAARIVFDRFRDAAKAADTGAKLELPAL